MVIGVILGIVLFVALCGFGIWSGVKFYKAWDDCDKKHIPTAIVALALAIVSLVAFIVVPFSYHTVDTGNVVVIKELGKIVEVKQPGTYFDFWVTRNRTTYDTRVQSVPIETMAYSSDAQTMTLKMTLQYEILSDEVAQIATKYGSLDALQTRITAVVTDRIKAVMSSYKAMDIIANRAEMSPAIEEAIRNAVGAEYHVNIVTIAITDIEFSESFENAVEEKMIAEQKQLKADYENQTKIAQAEADAKAKLLAAEAEAEANKLLEQTLTEMILQEMYLDKWNGELPEVVAGDDMSMILPDYSTTAPTE